MPPKKKPGPKPELFKVVLPFEDAIQAALEKNPPPPEKQKAEKKKR